MVRPEPEEKILVSKEVVLIKAWLMRLRWMKPSAKGRVCIANEVKGEDYQIWERINQK